MAIHTAVLLPGLDGTGDLFGPFVRAAPEGIDTIVVDYPIHEASIELLERRAREKLVNGCIVIAESFSGPIAVRVAVDPRVQALVLCNSFIRSPISPLLRYFPIAPLLAIPLPKFVLRSFLLGQQASPALLEATTRAIRRVPANTVAQRIRQVLQTNEHSTVQSLSKPILYLRGLADNLVSENSWKILQQLRPDARIVRLNGPHMLLQTSPQECWEAIAKFADESSRGGHR
jgi:pimeloyl-ACP methyl ester carboxylesterase